MTLNKGLTNGLSHLAWLLAETITVIATEKRRAIHDYIAGSVVVRVEIRGPAIEQPGGFRRKN